MGKRLLRLGFDIDGVLSNFVDGFLTLVNRESGTVYRDEDWTEYGGPNGPAFMTPEQWRRGWAALQQTPYFWANLKPTTSVLGLIGKHMANLEFNGYFFTRRMDLNTTEPGDAALLTRLWLEKYNIRDYTSLLVTQKQSRISLLAAAEVDAYLDDWADQFLEVEAAGINAFLIDRPYNRHIETSKRVFSIQEYMERATGNAALGPFRASSDRELEVSAVQSSLPNTEIIVPEGTTRVYFAVPVK